MPIVNCNNPIPIFNGLHLRISHFARGTFPCNRRSTYPWNRLLLILGNPEERGFFADEAVKLLVAPGSVYLLPAFRTTDTLLDEGTTFLSIHFNLELYRGGDLFAELPGIRALERPEFIREADRLFDETNEFLQALSLKDLIYRLILEFAPQLPFYVTEMVEKWRDYRPLLNLLRSGKIATLAVGEIADAMGMRHDVFTRQFTRDIGIAPKAFLNRQLLSRASELLSTSDEPLREIAEKLGFNNEFYFSRFFRKHTGIAPGKYRNGGAG